MTDYRLADLPAEIMASSVDDETLTLEVCLPGEAEARRIVATVTRDADGAEADHVWSCSAPHAEWASDNHAALASEWVRLTREARRG